MLQRTLRFCLLSLSIATISNSPAAAASKQAFPSTQSSVSPNGRYAIVSLDSGSELSHTLFLEDLKTHQRRKLLEYERSIEILWNPNSTLIAVNDFMGSNISECYLYSISGDLRKIDIEDKILAKQKSPKKQRSIEQDDHVYWEVIRWLDSKTLKVKVSGHGKADPQGFAFFCTYRMPQP